MTMKTRRSVTDTRNLAIAPTTALASRTILTLMVTKAMYPILAF